MLLLSLVVFAILGVLGIKRLLRGNRKHRQQIRFIRETLAANCTFDNAVSSRHYRRCPTGSTI
jgi:hypothetical protein